MEADTSAGYHVGSTLESLGGVTTGSLRAEPRRWSSVSVSVQGATLT